MKAFKVTIPRFDDEADCAIVFHDTASKARYALYSNITEHYPNIKITDIRVVRANQYDRDLKPDEYGRPLKRIFNPDYLPVV